MGRVLLPILFLVVSVGLYFTYIAKAMGEVQALKTEDAGYDQLLASAKKIRDRRAELTEQYKQLDAGGLKKVQKMIPDHIDNVRLLIDIDNIASVYGLRIRDFTFSNDQATGNATAASAEASAADTGAPESPTHQYKTATMSFQVTASYANLLSFLKDLERSLRIIDITKIELSSADKSASGYVYKITLHTYWLP
jgi:Tfp pilus assembly protein PilO